jgi:hypothetical protein
VFGFVDDQYVDHTRYDPNKAYYFGFAAFDNAQVRHSVSGEPLKMVFAKWAAPTRRRTACRGAFSTPGRRKERSATLGWRFILEVLLKVLDVPHSLATSTGLGTLA